MSRIAGKTIPCLAQYKAIAEAIKSFGLGNEFTRQELWEKIKNKEGMSCDVMYSFLFQKKRKGFLQKLEGGRYKILTMDFSINLPQAFVAEKVFAVLRAAKVQNEKLTSAQITERVEEIAGSLDLDLVIPCRVAINRWHKDGHLNRYGIGGMNDPHEYELKAGITERPCFRSRTKH